MNNDKKNIPELRFPEFEGDGEWIVKLIGEGFISFSGGTPSTSEKDYYGGLIPFIRSAEINRDQTELFLTEKGLVSSSAKMVNKGDLLIALYGANSGDSAISKINGAINQAILCLQAKVDYSNVFTHYLWSYRKEWIVTKFIQGGQGNLSGEIVKSVPVPIPGLKEQQKIASCLSSLDEVIAAHNQKLDLLKEHKKSLMQNLFPREGEKVPRYRFPEFVKAQEWQRKTIEQIAKVTTGNKNTQDKVDNGLYPFFVRSQTVERINSYSFEGEAILTTGDGVGVGKNFHYINGKFGFHQRVYCIYDFPEEVCGQFVFMYFSQHFYERVMRMNAKNSVDSVRRAMITDMPIFLPGKGEQEKIASCLLFLDELITAQTEKIEQLIQHKKGLMQGLFPKMND
ncbi:type I restriction enzyme, S subunit [Chitinophaga jiangningensis]|uniref:Type I restriction enzyme, S subunit n=1 Tax=Chitinophaga jiangningensis TaxID=1419482 RepID=A0A1M6XVB3_9BACT|nr:restriction endonuclease subunit S [Chitinophaga jiangningensis]SHL09917.1 type I restriction enzyme, S subunit [Chitinophaga jiangningensis]